MQLGSNCTRYRPGASPLTWYPPLCAVRAKPSIPPFVSTTVTQTPASGFPAALTALTTPETVAPGRSVALMSVTSRVPVMRTVVAPACDDWQRNHFAAELPLLPHPA